MYHYLWYLLERLPGTDLSDEAFEKYLPWNPEVKADLEETIRLDMENYGNALDYMCMWIEPEDAASHEENWVSIWMLN